MIRKLEAIFITAAKAVQSLRDDDGEYLDYITAIERVAKHLLDEQDYPRSQYVQWVGDNLKRSTSNLVRWISRKSNLIMDNIELGDDYDSSRGLNGILDICEYLKEMDNA